MSVKYKTTINKLPEVAATIKTLNGRKVHVGSLQGEAQYYASIMEYG